MQFSQNPRDLFEPGRADNFFEIEHLSDLSASSAFDRSAALWMAEFSRLIYRQGPDEIGSTASADTRDILLRAQGWREHAFINRGSAQAGLFLRDTDDHAVLVFRGTLGLRDVFTDGDLLMSKWPGAGLVHAGFGKTLAGIWSWCEEQLRSLNCPVYFTGHSLGGALATLTASRVLADPTLPRPSALYSFGSPRIGNAEFAGSLQELPHFRCVNDQDLVAAVPPAFSVPGFPVYQHTGSLHRARADHVMEVSAPGADVHVELDGAGGFADFTRAVKSLLQPIALNAPIPQSLIDHAPVNYVARLERLS